MIDTLSLELLRILAGRGRVEIIRALRAHPDRDFTINELARASGVPTMTTWRAVKQLRSAGLLKARRVGKAVAVTLTDDREKLRALKLVPDTDPQRNAAKMFAKQLAEHPWALECRLFGTIARGEHLPGEEIDVALVFDGSLASREEAEGTARRTATDILERTNIGIVPLLIESKDMERKGGLAAELRDKESIWRRAKT